MDNALAVKAALAWLDANGIACPRALLFDLILAAKFRPTMGLDEIADEYNTRLYAAMDDYTQSDKPITKFRNEFRRTINDGMLTAGFVGWVDAGGSGETPAALTTWINAQIDRDVAFADDVWRELREMRKTATADEMANEISKRALGYTNALTGIYGYARTFPNPDRLGIWRYGDTIDHCESDGDKTGCANLEGQTHPLSWYRERGLIPQMRGNDKITCGGWQCQCTVVDPETGEVLLP